mmetsp:Transcript_77372/g.199152  ORF Transcript_77372/g.199152 Transcript_77372/m.199152 type:complete len:439 (+) Transcript_77372:135-1451(+)
MPFRKGSSAGASCSRAASRLLARVAASLTYVSQATLSRCARVEALTPSSRSCAFFARVISLLRAAFSTAAAVASCASMDFTAPERAPCATPTAASIDLICSSIGFRSPIGVARASAFVTSISTSLILSSSPLSTSLLFSSFPPSAAARLKHRYLWWASFRRACSLDSSATREGSFASFCLEARTLRASVHAAAASFSASAACSLVALRLSAETRSRLSVDSRLVTSARVRTWLSASSTFSMTSRSSACVLRFSVSFLNSTSFVCRPSVRAWILPSSSRRSSRRTSPSSAAALTFASLTLDFTKLAATSRAFEALRCAISQSLMACTASACGSTSIPFRKGISASAVATTSSSAWSTFSCACWRIRVAARPSFCLPSALRTSSSFTAACFVRSARVSSSVLTTPSAVRMRRSICWLASRMQELAGASASSVLLTSSSLI